jgi:hypothetical protein
MTDTLETRVAHLEAAVLELTTARELEFVGDLPGHAFRGNQYSDVSGKEARMNAEADRKTAAALGPRPAPKNGVPQMRPKAEREGQTVGQAEAAAKAIADEAGRQRFLEGRGAIPVQRTDAAAKVGLKSFDHAEPGDPKLPTKDALRGGGATTFVRSFGYPEPGKGTGLWVMQHDASGTRLEGTGTRTAVQAGIKSQYPASGTWSILP